MALIVLHGPKAIDAALAFKKGMGFPAWDLSPDIPEVVRVDVLSALTVKTAIDFCNKAADVDGWLSHDGWIARPMAPVETFDGIPGVAL